MITLKLLQPLMSPIKFSLWLLVFKQALEEAVQEEERVKMKSSKKLPKIS